VQAWLGKAKAESAVNREGRLALLAEVAAWTQAHESNTDWKTQARELHHFSERWRNSGHLSEKAFADMQTQWKAAIKAAHVGLEAAQTQSITLRRAMIETHQRYLPVMDGEVVLGVLSFHDVARAVLEAQGFENRMLKAYIRDWPAEG
jgi:hypothetical protein